MTNPTPMPRRNTAPIDNVENELKALTVTAPPRNTMMIDTRLDDLGKMSAEAVLTQYEATAKEVEAMGNLVKDMVRKLGQSLIECDNDMKVVAETAAAIRDKGKHSEALISQVTNLSKNIREACAAFQKQMGA